MARHRIRIRFRKQGDLRLIGHRDLLRTFERLFRRAGWSLRMSEGFHPKVRMSFPSALAVGIEGVDEVMEVELSEPVSSEDLAEQLNAHAPPGLTICQAQMLAGDAARPRITRVVYEIPIPADRRASLQAAARRLLAQPSHLIDRAGRSEPVDIRADLEDVDVLGGVLRIFQRISGAVSARPREVLEALEAADLQQKGYCLRRTNVELAR